MRNHSRRMFSETASAIRFVSQRFLQVSALYLVIAIGGYLVFWVVATMRGMIPQSSLLLTFCALLLGQVAIATRMWSKIALYAAEMHFFDSIVPGVEQVPRLLAMTPEFAAAIEETDSGNQTRPASLVE